MARELTTQQRRHQLKRLVCTTSASAAASAAFLLTAASDLVYRARGLLRVMRHREDGPVFVPYQEQLSELEVDLDALVSDLEDRALSLETGTTQLGEGASMREELWRFWKWVRAQRREFTWTVYDAEGVPVVFGVPVGGETAPAPATDAQSPDIPVPAPAPPRDTLQGIAHALSDACVGTMTDQPAPYSDPLELAQYIQGRMSDLYEATAQRFGGTELAGADMFDVLESAFVRLGGPLEVGLSPKGPEREKLRIALDVDPDHGVTARDAYISREMWLHWGALCGWVEAHDKATDLAQKTPISATSVPNPYKIEDAGAIAFELHPEFKSPPVAQIDMGERRWHHDWLYVMKRDDETYWGVHVGLGATEHQEHEFTEAPFQVFPREVTIPEKTETHYFSADGVDLGS
jgi:hypothetical protein